MRGLAERPGRWARTGLGLLVGGGLLVALVLARGWGGGEVRSAAGEGAPGPPRSMGAELPPPRAHDPDVPLPDGFLGAILGASEEEGPRAEFCDDEHWSRVDWLIREIRDGELLVDDEAWARQGASTRAGIASWVSKCHLDGGAVRVVGAASGRQLAAFPGPPDA